MPVLPTIWSHNQLLLWYAFLFHISPLIYIQLYRIVKTFFWNSNKSDFSFSLYCAITTSDTEFKMGIFRINQLYIIKQNVNYNIFRMHKSIICNIHCAQIHWIFSHFFSLPLFVIIIVLFNCIQLNHISCCKNWYILIPFPWCMTRTTKYMTLMDIYERIYNLMTLITYSDSF